MITDVRKLRWGTVAVALSTVLVAGCQNLPQGLAGLPFMQNSAADAEALKAEPPPPEPRQWPQQAQDVLAMRAQGHGLVHMPDMQRYLDGLYARIKEAAGVPDWPGSVYVMASTGLEAMATGAGNLYVSQAWLRSLASEDEAVALLAHEFAHVYLHYHKLADVVPALNATAGLLSAGAALALQAGGAAGGWSAVDTAMVSYAVSRDVLSTAWARSQESAADMLGMNISLRLGYSYEAGYKTLLERLATWEDERSRQRKVAADKLAETIRQQAADRVRQRMDPGGGPANQAIGEPLALLAGALEGGLHQGVEGLGGLWSTLTASHPDIVGRLDRLAMAVDHLPPDMMAVQAQEAPWRQAVGRKRTAAILTHHALAAEALEDLGRPGALAKARQAASGVTARHALPLHAVYRARLQQAGGHTPTAAAKASEILNANLSSSQDRAWAAYAERIDALSAARQWRAARAVMADAFEHFSDAPQIWPYSVRFMGETDGWEAAKRLASECGRRFAAQASACAEAALSPSERRQRERQSEAKAQQLVDKLFR